MIKNENLIKNERCQYTVYKLTFPNNKVYIGKTQRKPSYRWGKNGSGYKFQKNVWDAICEYGWHNIDKQIIEQGLDKNEASEKEQYYIKLYNAMDNNKGYNMTAGGDGMYGWHPSEEHRQIIIKTNKTRVISEESRRKNAESQRRNIAITGIIPFKGRHHSDETKRILSEKAKLRPAPIMTEEIKRKISEANKRRKKGPLSEEHKKKISIANTGHCVSEITRKKMSQKSSGINNGMYGKHGVDNPNSKVVLQYSLCNEFIAEYPSIKDAYLATNASISGISQCCNGIIKKHKGSIWKFKSKEKE